ncbi:histone deacetylase, partial [Quaeritorhiza haematococci]
MVTATPTPTVLGPHSKTRISYFYNQEVSKFHFGEGHPMKPPRLALTHDLVVNYGLHKRMSVYSPRRATDEEIAEFHAEDYVEFLKRITPDNVANFAKFMPRFNLGVEDCPIFDGMYDFCALYSGASLEAARKLISGHSDIAINWSGGLHHAHMQSASGFCYINDIVLAILQLLRYYPRVLYVDIDVHHGDGVQEAFFQSDRVMTVSFHRYDGSFFPGTGSLDEIGVRHGKHYALNVPLQENIDDTSYAYIFQSVMKNVMESFRPGAIVLQCGADSLASDRLGCFNLSIKGHGDCVQFMKNFNVPMMVVGGGGYTIRNVSRCWTYETAVLTDMDLPNSLPDTDYRSHFGPDYSLHPPIVDPTLSNANSRQYLDHIRIQIAEYLRHVEGAPSVQMQEIPPDVQGFLENGNWEVDEMEDMFPDVRVGGDGGMSSSSSSSASLSSSSRRPSANFTHHTMVDSMKKRRDKDRPDVLDSREYYDGEHDHDRD